MGVSPGYAKVGGAYGNGSGSYNSGFQPITLGTVSEMTPGLFTQKDASRVQMTQGGLYALDLVVTRSDLPANQTFIVAYNVNDDGTQNHEFKIIQGQYGWNQTTVNNSIFQHSFHTAHRFNAGDYIYFYISTDDGPRSYTWNWRVIRLTN